MAIQLETFIPGLQENGFNTSLNATFNGNLTVVGTTNIAAVSLTNLTTTGNTVLGNATSDTTTVNGVLTVTSVATVVGTVCAGGLSVKSATVPASAGAVTAGPAISMFASGPSIYVTSDAPTFSAIKGSLCVATDGSSTSTRLFINNGTTSWIAITTAS